LAFGRSFVGFREYLLCATYQMKLLDKWIERQYRLLQVRNAKKNLQYEFTDEMGRKWYTYIDDGLMSMGRLAEQNTHLQYLATGLSGEQFTEAINTAFTLFDKGEHSKAGAVLIEIQEMPKRVINLHAFINIVAVSYLRDDEDINAFSTKIHQEKCDWMLNQIDTGRFFFQHPSFVRECKKYQLTGKMLENNLNAYRQVLANFRAFLNTVRSQKESEQ
jgi:hypothetical protein